MRSKSFFKWLHPLFQVRACSPADNLVLNRVRLYRLGRRRHWLDQGLVLKAKVLAPMEYFTTGVKICPL